MNIIFRILTHTREKPICKWRFMMVQYCKDRNRRSTFLISLNRRGSTLSYKFLDVGDLLMFSQVTVSAFADPANTHVHSCYSP